MAALTGALLALGAANTFSKFIGDRRSAAGAQAQGDYQSQVYEENAALAEQRAADAIARGKVAEDASRGATKATLSDQDVSEGAQGIDLSTGSAVDVRKNDQAMGELDALTIRNNARREQWGFQVEAANYRQEGLLAKTAGDNAAASYRNRSIGTLLQGAGELATTYQRFGLSKTTTTAVPRVSSSDAGSTLGGYSSRTASR